MSHLPRTLPATLVVALGLFAVLATAYAGEEKVPLDKLPKAVVDAVKAKFPKAALKHATKEKADGKDVYEIGIDVDKKHMHCLVTPEGKLFEIHRDVDDKDVPAKVAKAVQTKYPKGKWVGVEEMSDGDGKVFAYEISVEVANGEVIEVEVGLDGKIRKETKLDPKKDKK